MKFEITVPHEVQYIIDTFYAAGQEAYAVGGCVRDAFMGKTPNDWDICTSAAPEITKDLFENTVDTGIKHGTITVILDKTPYEVTTFRIDGDYKDSRHPEKVEFVKSVEEDLKRRDFTINAMAYNDKTGLIDPFGGRCDIENKIIRCVGEPDLRFGEDALRIMRGLRFSATLGFEIDGETAKSMVKNKDLLNNIAAERIQTELLKLLGGDGGILTEFEDIFKVFLPEGKFESAAKTPGNLRIYALFDFENSAEAMRKLKFSNDIIKKILAVTKNAVPKTLSEARFLYGKIGADNLKNLLLLRKKSLDFSEEIEKNQLCCSIKDLDINGRQIMEITGGSGEKIGEILDELLHAVIEKKLENSFEYLKNYILKRKD